MENNMTTTTNNPRPPGILSAQDFLIHFIIKACAGSLLSILGIFTNAVCIHVFLKMKAGDAVSTGFLGLACTDLIQSICTLAHNVISGLWIYESIHGPRLTHDSFMLIIFQGNVTNTVTVVTTLITLYLAMARCACVAFPLRFRSGGMFTRNQTRLAVSGAWLFAVSLLTPVFANTGSQEIHNPFINASRHVLWFSPQRESIKDVVYMFAMVVLPFCTQVILVLCIITMTRKLLQASRFRQSTANTGRTKDNIKAKPGLDLDENDNTTGSNVVNMDNGGKTSSHQLSGKELQAVKQVVIICVLFVLCNTPCIVVASATMAVPGYEASAGYNRYIRLYTTSHEYRRVIEQINNSINIFIYYRFNTKFRECCSLLPKCIQMFIGLALKSK